MIRFVLAGLLCVASGAAFAQDASGTASGSTGSSETSDSDWTKEIEAAAGKSAEGSASKGETSASSSSSTARGTQSLNPDISAILDVGGGFWRVRPYSLAGDDPNLRGGPVEHPAGFTVQEAEIAFQSVVDPYFRADLFLTIPNLEGIEVEEGMIATTGLPWNLQVKAGIFRSAIGRQNGQHLHLQDFSRRPLINEAYLGPDGLRSPGVQVSWLLPVPFFLQLFGEVFSVGPLDETPVHLATFGGGQRIDLTYVSELKAFWPVTESTSVYGGLNFASGVTPGVPDVSVPGATLRAGARTYLEGADLYVKYKPPNETGGYFSAAWTTEFYLRQVMPPDASEDIATDGGMYTQLVLQLERRWYLGVREDLLGVPSSALQQRVQRTSLSLTFAASEFARVRAYVERGTLPGVGDGIFGGPQNWGAYLQLEASIGAHGAHPF